MAALPAHALRLTRVAAVTQPAASGERGGGPGGPPLPRLCLRAHSARPKLKEPQLRYNKAVGRGSKTCTGQP